MSQTREHLRQWIEWTEGMAVRVHDTAKAGPLGGDAAWRQLMDELQAEPLLPEEKATALQGAPTPRGALPIEVRRCLQRIVDQAGPVARQFDEVIDPSADDDDQRTVDRWQHRLRDLVEHEVKRYLDAVRPAPTTAGIFATALATARPTVGAMSGPAVSTLTCPSCGAPRGQDDAAPLCQYCGANIFAR